MKRLVFLVSVVALGAGFYTYRTNSDFRSRVDKWIHPHHESDSAAAQKKSPKSDPVPKLIKPDQFAEIDRYARNTPEKYAGDVKELAEYLSKPAKNELQKVRSIFTWVATHIKYDAEAYNTGKYGDQHSETYVLRKRKAVCQGYSTLFEALAHEMKLEVVTVVGYAKGYSYKIGSKFKDTNHAWNAVKIDGVWQLIDATWASGYGEPKKGKLVSTQKYDPFWFCVDPAVAIFSHLPEDQQWQLIKEPLSLREFEQLPYIEHVFFKLGFNGSETLLSARSGAITEFAKAYPVDYPTKVVGLPMNKNISRNREYIFTVLSDYAEKVAIIDEGKWIYFEKEGDKFSRTYQPKGKSISVVVKNNSFESFFTILSYEVDDETEL